jgi:hypothetical protein
MANEIEIGIRVDGSQATGEVDDFSGAIRRVASTAAQEMGSTEDAFDSAARGASTFGAGLDKAAGFAGQMSDGIAGVGDAASAVSDIMNHGERKAIELAQAHEDVAQAAQDAEQAALDLEQAQRDLAQSGLDAKQAAVDTEQAMLDQKVAMKDYNAAVKEHGKNSIEAKQAQIDLKQANVDLAQATEDAKQASMDGFQAELDATQAKRDSSQASIDLAAANQEVATQSSGLQKVAEWSGMLSGVLGGLVGVIGAITAVQWAWNAAMAANPVVLIILAIVALVAIIVVIAMKTDWFQRLWRAIWSKIGDPVKASINFIVNAFKLWWAYVTTVLSLFKKVFMAAFKTAIDFAVKYFKFIWSIPGKIKDIFSRIGGWISAPFRAGFNAVARAWNNTIGRLSWSIPGWVPGIGGNSISAPRLPTFQTGSSEILRTGLAMVHKGEKIVPAHGRGWSGGGGILRVEFGFREGVSSSFARAIQDTLTVTARTKGGSVETSVISSPLSVGVAAL